jgi:radical SAM superfamily enzyme YgiQ (UPF0313 family)
MRLLLIAPWSYAYGDETRLPTALGDVGVAWLAPASIATVAALAPSDFRVSLCDETVEPVDFDAAVDAVGISANVSQVRRAIAIAGAFRARGKVVIMGGPHVSLAPEAFEGHADCIVVGEFEPIAETVFADLRNGTLKSRYDGSRADLCGSPAPRWDLYRNDRAVSGVVQTSRGCPFECNFCDVIQYLGRVQRHKDNAQVIAEVQNLYDLGYNSIVLADDNFTVYRKRAKALLRALAAWNGAEGRDYVVFATQVSIDAARDQELLALCNDAGLLHLFVGIETSDADNLKDSKKRQNLHVDLAAEVRKLVSHGLRVQAGLIVGFDHDDRSVFARQFEFAMTLPVPTFKTGVLVAPIGTPLYVDMQAAGRIANDDLLTQYSPASLVTNLTPARMSRDDLYIGTKWLVSKLFDPENFYIRLKAMSELLAPPPWERRGGRKRPLLRPDIAAALSQVRRTLSRSDPRIVDVIQRTFALMRDRPQARQGVGEALSHYLMNLRSSEVDGLYDRAWARMDAPPFGIASANQLERIRADWKAQALCA